MIYFGSMIWDSSRLGQENQGGRVNYILILECGEQFML